MSAHHDSSRKLVLHALSHMCRARTRKAMFARVVLPIHHTRSCLHASILCNVCSNIFNHGFDRARVYLSCVTLYHARNAYLQVFQHYGALAAWFHARVAVAYHHHVCHAYLDLDLLCRPLRSLWRSGMGAHHHVCE
jgi:hypothetical protein